MVGHFLTPDEESAGVQYTAGRNSTWYWVLRAINVQNAMYH